MNDEWGCPEVWRVLFCGKSLKSETAHFYIYIRIISQLTWHFKLFLGNFFCLIVYFLLDFIHFQFRITSHSQAIYITQCSYPERRSRLFRCPSTGHSLPVPSPTRPKAQQCSRCSKHASQRRGGYQPVESAALSSRAKHARQSP